MASKNMAASAREGALREDGAAATIAAPAGEGAREAAFSANVFTVSGLRFAYPGTRGRGVRTIFDGLDLALPEGVVTTLIGANGSGKSTLFNLLTKNLRPQGGKIYLRGGDVGLMRLRDFARLVAIVHQKNAAPGDITVRKLVEYGRFAHHAPGRAASTDEDGLDSL